jgi:hypothetical protein
MVDPEPMMGLADRGGVDLDDKSEFEEGGYEGEYNLGGPAFEEGGY